MMIKIKRKIAYIALFLFIALSPPLQATHVSGSNSDSRNYTNSYLVKVFNLRDISGIVIDYVSGENENFTSFLDLTIRLKYYQHAQQMISKAQKESPLIWSAYFGHVDLLKYLVEQGADIHAKDDKYGSTALMWAAYKGHLSCLKCLVEQGADINAKDDEGYTALIWSAKKGHLACVQYLAEQGADINAKNKWGYTALILSAKQGHLAFVKYLCQQGADINAKGEYGYTALMWSAKKGHLACVHYLVEQGADINAKNEWGKTALMYKAERDRGYLTYTKLFIILGGVLFCIMHNNRII